MEQIVEHQLDQKKSSEANGLDGEEAKLNSKRETENFVSGGTCISSTGQEATTVEELSPAGQEVTTIEEPSPAGQEVTTTVEPFPTGQESQGKSPKKSRRKKKHNTVQG